MFLISDVISSTRVMFDSLKPGLEVYVDVINAWAHILNREESKRSRDSIHRLFCTGPMIVSIQTKYNDRSSYCVIVL